MARQSRKHRNRFVYRKRSTSMPLLFHAAQRRAVMKMNGAARWRITWLFCSCSDSISVRDQSSLGRVDANKRTEIGMEITWHCGWICRQISQRHWPEDVLVWLHLVRRQRLCHLIAAQNPFDAEIQLRFGWTLTLAARFATRRPSRRQFVAHSLTARRHRSNYDSRLVINRLVYHFSGIGYPAAPPAITRKSICSVTVSR